MKKRVFLGIGVGLILGMSGTVQAWWDNRPVQALIKLHGGVQQELDAVDASSRRLDQMLHSQPPGPTVGRSPAPSLGTSAVYIWNSDRFNSVNFSIIGNSCSLPLTTFLYPSHYNTFTCPNANAFEIMVSTTQANGSIVTKRYNLRPAARYLLLYDGGISAWDVKEMTHPGPETVPNPEENHLLDLPSG